MKSGRSQKLKTPQAGANARARCSRFQFSRTFALERLEKRDLFAADFLDLNDVSYSSTEYALESTPQRDTSLNSEEVFYPFGDDAADVIASNPDFSETFPSSDTEIDDSFPSENLDGSDVNSHQEEIELEGDFELEPPDKSSAVADLEYFEVQYPTENTGLDTQPLTDPDEQENGSIGDGGNQDGDSNLPTGATGAVGEQETGCADTSDDDDDDDDLGCVGFPGGPLPSENFRESEPAPPVNLSSSDPVQPTIVQPPMGWVVSPVSQGNSLILAGGFAALPPLPAFDQLVFPTIAESQPEVPQATFDHIWNQPEQKVEVVDIDALIPSQIALGELAGEIVSRASAEQPTEVAPDLLDEALIRLVATTELKQEKDQAVRSNSDTVNAVLVSEILNSLDSKRIANSKADTHDGLQPAATVPDPYFAKSSESRIDESAGKSESQERAISSSASIFGSWQVISLAAIAILGSLGNRRSRQAIFEAIRKKGTPRVSHRPLNPPA